MRDDLNDNSGGPTNDWSFLIYGVVFLVGVAIALGVGSFFS
ncbi:hypothetical protein [Phyllobacterium sophorae]|jgi:hypothetical protein|nr:hypothetical protein [Phyllobacterium sophorae]